MERVQRSGKYTWVLITALVLMPQVAKAQQTWFTNVGGETPDHGVQADAFLSNELWIIAGDSIKWTFVPKSEIHTVTFLDVALPQSRPPYPAGCSGAPPHTITTPSGSAYNGSECVNSGPLANGAAYTVTFPTAGNYKLVCLVHTNMNGVVHVLPVGAASPHDQGFYDDVARDEKQAILSDSDGGIGQSDQNDEGTLANEVTAGVGEIVATGGGRQYRAVVRFLKGTIHVRVGDTVEWTNLDPTEPHTVTFGTEPGSPQSAAGLDAVAQPDGALHATISLKPGDPALSVSSGFLAAAAEDRIGSPQSSPGTTRIRITFAQEGTYNYICALHDGDGMVGQVIVSKKP